MFPQQVFQNVPISHGRVLPTMPAHRGLIFLIFSLFHSSTAKVTQLCYFDGATNLQSRDATCSKDALAVVPGGEADSVNVAGNLLENSGSAQWREKDDNGADVFAARFTGGYFSLKNTGAVGEVGATMGGGAFSVCTGVHYTAFNRNSRIFDFGKDAGNHNIFLGNVERTSTLVWGLITDSDGNEVRIEVDNLFTLDQWDHICVTVGAKGAMTVYKNGEEVRCTGGNMCLTVTGKSMENKPLVKVAREQLLFGKSNWKPDTYEMLSAWLKDFHIFDGHLLTEAQTRQEWQRAFNQKITQHCFLTGDSEEDALVSVCPDAKKLAVAPGLIVTDPAQSLVKVGSSIQVSVNDVGPLPTQGGVFNGGYFSVKNGLSDFGGKPFTVCANVLYDQGFPRNGYIFDFSGAQSYEDSVLVKNNGKTNGLFFGILQGTGGSKLRIIEASNFFDLGKWTHMCVTADKSGTMRSFKNGVEVKCTDGNACDNAGVGTKGWLPLKANRVKSHIGGSSFLGEISDFVLYDGVALSVEGIGLLRKLSVSKPSTTTASTTTKTTTVSKTATTITTTQTTTTASATTTTVSSTTISVTRTTVTTLSTTTTATATTVTKTTATGTTATRTTITATTISGTTTTTSTETTATATTTTGTTITRTTSTRTTGTKTATTSTATTSATETAGATSTTGTRTTRTSRTRTSITTQSTTTTTAVKTTTITQTATATTTTTVPSTTSAITYTSQTRTTTTIATTWPPLATATATATTTTTTTATTPSTTAGGTVVPKQNRNPEATCRGNADPVDCALDLFVCGEMLLSTNVSQECPIMCSTCDSRDYAEKGGSTANPDDNASNQDASNQQMGSYTSVIVGAVLGALALLLVAAIFYKSQFGGKKGAAVMNELGRNTILTVTNPVSPQDFGSLYDTVPPMQYVEEEEDDVGQPRYGARIKDQGYERYIEENGPGVFASGAISLSEPSYEHIHSEPSSPSHYDMVDSMPGTPTTPTFFFADERSTTYHAMAGSSTYEDTSAVIVPKKEYFDFDLQEEDDEIGAGWTLADEVTYDTNYLPESSAASEAAAVLAASVGDFDLSASQNHLIHANEVEIDI